MKKIKVSDKTIVCVEDSGDFSLSFKEKIEVCKLLDKLNLDVIELQRVKNQKIDSLLIKSIATAVKSSTIAVPMIPGDDPSVLATALKEAKSFRLQVVAPVSSVRMEYDFHKKPAVLQEMVINSIKEAKQYTEDVEFVAEDASRSDRAFLYGILEEAIKAGAGTVTVTDDAGAMLPNEFAEFVGDVYENVPSVKDVTLAVSCSNALAMSDASVIASLQKGATEVKTAAAVSSISSLYNIVKLLADRGETFDCKTDVNYTQIKRIVGMIERFCNDENKSNVFGVSSAMDSETEYLNIHDDKDAVAMAVSKLGYELSEEDGKKVFEAFSALAKKKDKVSTRELDSIVASVALQVPASYELASYVVNTGSHITSMVHVTLNTKEGEKQGISLGDGPIDAAFMAIEQITGRHFELDDFQIRAISEGNEASGETIVKLRYEGKSYSGRGSSTDIIGSGIQAYINALNKLVYEKDEM